MKCDCASQRVKTVASSAGSTASMGRARRSGRPGGRKSRVVTLMSRQPALGRAAREVVLDAKSRVDANTAIVMADREMDDQLPLHLSEQAPGAIGEAKHLGSGVEAALRG